MNKELKVGYKPHRLKENDPYHAIEIAFVEEINKELSYNSTFLSDVVGKNPHYLTEEEEKIALSVIQWLGTPVGQGFLESVNNKVKRNE